MKCTICNTEITKEFHVVQGFLSRLEMEKLRLMQKNRTICPDCGRSFLLCVLKGEKNGSGESICAGNGGE